MPMPVGEPAHATATQPHALRAEDDLRFLMTNRGAVAEG